MSLFFSARIAPFEKASMLFSKLQFWFAHTCTHNFVDVATDLRFSTCWCGSIATWQVRFSLLLCQLRMYTHNTQNDKRVMRPMGHPLAFPLPVQSFPCHYGLCRCVLLACMCARGCMLVYLCRSVCVCVFCLARGVFVFFFCSFCMFFVCVFFIKVVCLHVSCLVCY